MVLFLKKLKLVIPLLLASSAGAEEARARFDMHLFGLSLGEITMQRQVEDAAYHAEARFATTGAAGVLARLFFDISASGTLEGSQPRAALYSEKMDTGRRKTDTQVAFAPDDPRLDPMSALYAGLGDRPLEQGCDIDMEVFDGERTHRLTIAPREASGDVLVCTGSYTRVAGYPTWQIRWHPGYDFTVTYKAIGELLIAQTAQTNSYLGPIRLDRRQP